MSARLQAAGCRGLEQNQQKISALYPIAPPRGQLSPYQPSISVANGCFLEWNRWSADANMGLLHQMSSLGCAFADAVSTERTLLIPTHICAPRLHNRRMQQQNSCTALDRLIDLPLLSGLVQIRLGTSEPTNQTQFINFHCPSNKVREKRPCSLMDSNSHNHVVRSFNDNQFWFSACFTGVVDVGVILHRVSSSLGRNNWTIDAERLFPSVKGAVFQRSVAYTLLRSGLFFAPHIKGAAREIQRRLGQYVLVHVRRGDRIVHRGSAPGIDAEL